MLMVMKMLLSSRVQTKGLLESSVRMHSCGLVLLRLDWEM